MADVVRFADYGPRYRPVVHSEESALVIILPVIRIERYAVEPIEEWARKRGLPWNPKAKKDQRKRLRRHIGKTED